MESSFLFPVELLQAVIKKNIVSRYWTRPVSFINYLGFIGFFGEKFVLSSYQSFFVFALGPNLVLSDEKEITVPPQVPEKPEKQFTHPSDLVHGEETAQ